MPLGERENGDIIRRLRRLHRLIFIVPLMSIVPALLYLKMRQLGGESLADALAQIEEVDEQSSKWRKRMRTRLSLHTPRSTKKDSTPQSTSSKQPTG